MSLGSEYRPFGGMMTALVTPFRGDKVDFDALADLVDWQIEQGVQGLVVCGTTGESPALSHPEWTEVIRFCVEAVDRRVSVIAGTGTNDTRRTVELTNEAARIGVDGALVVTPYYSRPSQEGLFRHFESVGRNGGLPVLVYNVPARTGVDMNFDTLGRLAEIPGIVGLKDATGDVARVGATAVRFGDRFVQLSGHDRSMLGFVAAGGDGAISVVANVEPMLGAAMIGAMLRSDLEEARRIHALLLPLLEALELEVNPSPIKFALHCARGYSPRLRLPMVEVAGTTASKILDALGFIDAMASDAVPTNRILSMDSSVQMRGEI